MRPSFQHTLAIHALALLAAPAFSAQALDREGSLPRYLPVDLGVLPGGTLSWALDVNDMRQVAGTGTTGPMTGSGSMAFVWLPQPALGLPAGMSALGTLPLGASNGSWSASIDDCGRIVGEFHALDDLLTTRLPVRIALTGGMNRRGDIAITGYNAQGEYRAFLLLRVR